MSHRKEGGARARSAQETTDQSAVGLRSGARAEGRGDLAARMCGGWRGEERPHGATRHRPSGAEQE